MSVTPAKSAPVAKTTAPKSTEPTTKPASKAEVPKPADRFTDSKVKGTKAPEKAPAA
ncbi:MAG: hypothetical protein JNK82_17185, partial [Myxococcaceae bacterium]|nr:hypothetical protein [Myxococcaceae bacterium]